MMSIWRGMAGLGACLLAVGMAGCAGPIETRSGLTGTALPANAAVALAVSHEQDGPLVDAVRRAVAEQLAARGHPADAEGAARVVVTFAERPASLEVLAAKGAVLSAAKRRRALQNCADRTFRLTLVAERTGEAPSRAWAEEHHCKAAPGSSIGALAAQAAAALAGKTSARPALRSGQD